MVLEAEQQPFDYTSNKQGNKTNKKGNVNLP